MLRSTKMIISNSGSATKHLLRKSNALLRMNNCRRALSSYEYPNRTEAPKVTRTTASEAQQQQQGETIPKKTNETYSPKPEYPKDLFDDAGTYTETDRSLILSKQNESINRTLDPKHKITSEVPAFIPPNYNATQLDIPSVQISTLSPENQLRAVSQETYGQVTTLGVICDFGSRYEQAHNTGVNHLMELLAFQSTERKFNHGSEIVQKMDTLGGATYASSGREQLMYCVDILRPNVEEAMEILAETILRPRILPEEVEEMKQVMFYQYEERHQPGGMGSEIALGEGIQLAAYRGQNQQLGRVHFAYPEQLQQLSPETVRDFRSEHLAPHRMVISAAGIEHSQLMDLTEKYFSPSDLPSSLSSSQAQQAHPRVDSLYTGGEFRLPLPQINTSSSGMFTDNLTRVALAFEIPHGWSSPDLVPACVLQTLLGGGNSFSAGGPGKGMYSRLYLEILNRFYWAESAEAFTSFHAESGLLGMSGSTYNPQKIRDLVRVLADQFFRLATQDVTDEQLSRARNMLRCNVLTQLESRLVLFEDIGRQILTYGKREDVKSMCDKIDNVTKEDIRRVAQTMLKKPPTLCAVGGEQEVAMVPTYDEVSGWFQH